MGRALYRKKKKTTIKSAISRRDVNKFVFSRSISLPQPCIMATKTRFFFCLFSIKLLRVFSYRGFFSRGSPKCFFCKLDKTPTSHSRSFFLSLSDSQSHTPHRFTGDIKRNETADGEKHFKRKFYRPLLYKFSFSSIFCYVVSFVYEFLIATFVNHTHLQKIQHSGPPYIFASNSKSWENCR